MSAPRSHADTRAFWQDQVAIWRDSGLSKAAFCRDSGVHPASFSQWSRRLSSSASSGSDLTGSASGVITMIPVSVVDESESSSSRFTTQSVIATRSDITLTLPAAMDADQISIWLRSLASFDVQH